MSDIEIVVYHDSNYPSSWISVSRGYPTKIASSFHRYGFANLDADQLRKFIIESLNQQKAHRKIIVFAQDVVPNTICEEAHSNTLLREYLDAGGNVIWLGDVPLFYIGEKKISKPQQAWKSGAPVYMLGIIPIFSSTQKSVSLTSFGRILGLYHHWTSARPVLKDETITPLATSKNIGSDYYVNIPRPRGRLERLWGKLKRTEKIELPGGFKFQITPSEVESKKSSTGVRSTVFETHVSAWIKNYNEDFPYCGFYRIWDYIPRIMPFWMIDELVNFSLHVTKRIK